MFQIFVSLFPCFSVSFPCFPVSGKQGNRETAFLILKGKQGNKETAIVKIRETGKQFPCFPLVVFSLKYPKNGSRTYISHKFVVLKLNVPEKSRIFVNKISLVLEQIQFLCSIKV